MGQQAEAMAGFEAAGELVERTRAAFYEADVSASGAGLAVQRGVASAPPGRGARAAPGCAAVRAASRARPRAARRGPDSAALLGEAMERFPAGAGYPELNEAQALLAHTRTRT